MTQNKAIVRRRSLRCRMRATALAMAIAFAMLRLPSAAQAQEGPKASPVAAEPQSSADRDQIRDLIAKYAESIDGADTALASQVWWNSPEVSFINPVGWEHGFQQIKDEVYGRLMGQTFSERRLNVHDIAIHAYSDAAWAEFYWDFHAKLRKDGSPVTTHGRETQVYWKMRGRWRLVHVHYSGMPVAGPR